MLPKIKALLKHKGFKIFTRPYELNIVGLRSRNTLANRFDDELHVFYKTSPLHWEYHVFRITTDPGTFWLKNPMYDEGTAILAEGQYVNAYALGLHRGQYKALVQIKPVSILRDYNRDAVLDFYNGKLLSGFFGINIHRANKSGKTKFIDKNSAGCQVFENASDFDVFIKLCDRQMSLYGNKFTYTLIDFRSMRRQTYRWAAYTLGLISTAAIGLGIYFKKNKHASIFKTTIKRQNRQLQSS